MSTQFIPYSTTTPNEGWWLAKMPRAGVARTYPTKQKQVHKTPPTTAEVQSQRQRVLKGIRDNGPISTAQLAYRLGLQRGRVLRAAVHLVEAGQAVRRNTTGQTRWEAIK
jgi:biotin operon repressor